MRRSKIKKLWKKVWYFIWEDNSIWSWVANVLLAFILIKFIVYPGLGFLLGTNFPIVAVVSESMEHNAFPTCIQTEATPVFGPVLQRCSNYEYRICDIKFDSKQHFKLDEYWDICGGWYDANTEITMDSFGKFRFSNGFNKGDIMILKGAEPDDIVVGDILVFQDPRGFIPDPIIHRVVEIKDEGDWHAVTKGDHNSGPDGRYVSEELVVGKALVRIPVLGYIKIWFVEVVKFIIGGFTYVLS